MRKLTVYFKNGKQLNLIEKEGLMDVLNYQIFESGDVVVYSYPTKYFFKTDEIDKIDFRTTYGDEKYEEELKKNF